MKRQKAIGGAAVGVFLLGSYLLYGYLQEPGTAAAEFSSWPPGPAAIRSAIGTPQVPASGMSENERREQFCVMFKNRFRHHEPGLAIGLRFLTPTRIKLMCPARMEPYFVDQIALAAWHEARDDFGKSIDIDIYDTFIGTNQIKIGELRAVAEKPEMAHIKYDFTQLELLNRPRSLLPRSGRRFRPVEQRSLPPIYFRRREVL